MFQNRGMYGLERRMCGLESIHVLLSSSFHESRCGFMIVGCYTVLGVDVVVYIDGCEF